MTLNNSLAKLTKTLFFIAFDTYRLLLVYILNAHVISKHIIYLNIVLGTGLRYFFNFISIMIIIFSSMSHYKIFL